LTGDADYRINDNEVGDDLIVNDNTITGAGDIQVKDDTVGGDLLCSGNTPDPDTDSNTVTGTTECSD